MMDALGIAGEQLRMAREAIDQWFASTRNEPGSRLDPETLLDKIALLVSNAKNARNL